MSENFEHLQSEEDVEEILRLAVRQTGSDTGSLRERLAQSADELGISPEALAEAEREWAAKRRSESARELESGDRSAFRKMKVAELLQHAGVYAIVNAFLLWIDLRNGALNWAMWPIAGWGIAVALHALSVFVHGPDEEKEFQRWRKKRTKKSKES
ncbi:MAG: 2TM domain-containing protein [Armatimonadetes bacterium]|nr:2TM domain-containing protein [Armatimonadota bacterium]